MPDKEQVRAAGGCLCGRVRYTVRGPLRGVLVCHCGQCRRVHSYVGAYRSAAREAIARVAAKSDLSPDTAEIINHALQD